MIAAGEKTKSHPDVVDYFKELPFYNKKIEKPKIKRLKNVDLRFELPFYEELNVIETDHAELIESQYINVSTYRSLSGSSYIKLSVELRCSKKD